MSIYNTVDNVVKTTSDKNSTAGQAAAVIGFNPIAAGNIVGDWLGLGNSDAVNSALSTIDDVQSKADSVSEENRGLYDQWYESMVDKYGANADKYADAFQKYVDAVDSASGQTYSYDGDISDFYSPFAAQRKQAAMDAITNSAANAGGMFSSDYLNSLAAKQQALASEEWEKAFSRMQSDRQDDISEWNVNANQRQQDLSNAANVVSLYGNDRSALASAYGDYISSLASQNNADLSAASDLALKRAELQSGVKSGNAGVLGLAGNVLGAIF